MGKHDFRGVARSEATQNELRDYLPRSLEQFKFAASPKTFEHHRESIAYTVALLLIGGASSALAADCEGLLTACKKELDNECPLFAVKESFLKTLANMLKVLTLE